MSTNSLTLPDVGRFGISGLLTTQTPLSIGSGVDYSDRQLDEPWLANRPLRASALELNSAALIVRDAADRPYLPGSSLKGVLRASLARMAKVGGCDAADVVRLVGRAPNQDDAQDMGEGGRVIVRDAFVDGDWLRGHGFASLETGSLTAWDSTQGTFVEASVGIDRQTRAAATHRLMFREAVPPGVPFRLEFLLLTPDERLLSTLLAALEHFNSPFHTVPARLGANNNNNWGRLSWKSDRQIVKDVPAQKPQEHRMSDPLRWSSGWSLPGMVVLTAEVALQMSGPFQVHQALPTEQTPKEQQAADDDDRSAKVDQRPLVTSDGRPRLPASGFRGVLRSQLERIVRSQVPAAQLNPHRPAADPAQQSATEAAIRRLLGSSEHQSLFTVTDFLGDKESARRRQILEMVSIDRVTGAVAGSRKFNIDMFDRPRLTGQICLQLPADEEGLALVGLMVLVFRDLIEGDLSFGALATRGLGQCTASIYRLHILGLDQLTEHDTAWNDVLTRCNLPSTDQALDQTVGALIKSINGDGQNEHLKSVDALLDELLTRARKLIELLACSNDQQPTQEASA